MTFTLHLDDGSAPVAFPHLSDAYAAFLKGKSNGRILDQDGKCVIGRGSGAVGIITELALMEDPEVARNLGRAS